MTKISLGYTIGMAMARDYNNTDITRKDWAIERRQVLALTDALDRPMDQPIIDTVTALRLHGFNTISSCGGHVDGRAGGPYVLIESPIAASLAKEAMSLDESDSPGHQRLRRQANYHRAVLFSDLTRFLNAFYRVRYVEFESRLVAHSMPWALILLAPSAVDTTPIMTAGQRRNYLRANRTEVGEFARYLKAQSRMQSAAQS